MSLFEKPSHKLFVRDLQECKSATPTPSKQPQAWKFSLFGKDVTFTSLWVQGLVTKVWGRQEMALDDGTGVARVTLCDKVPMAENCIRVGCYVMVVGILLSCDPEPVIRPIKIQDLSADPIMETLWILEVIDHARVQLGT